jgi:putative inorganic carbon (HCO3(-)) transporter
MRSWSTAYAVAIVATFLTFPSGYSGYPVIVLPLLVLGEIASRRFQWRRTSLDRPMLAVVAAAWLSVAASPLRGHAAGVAALFTLMLAITTYCVTRFAARVSQPARAIVAVWIPGAIFAAIWGLTRAQPGLPLGASTPALAQNALGMTMGMTALLLLGLWTVADRFWVRAIVVGALPLVVATLELTWSRGAWIGTAVGAVVLLATAPRHRLQIATIAIAAVVVATVAIGAHRGPLAQRLQMIPNVDANLDRLTIWKTTLVIIRDHPIVGTGFGTFAPIWPRYKPAQAPEIPTAHNILLNFAAETGLLGLAAFVGFVGTGLRGLWAQGRAARGDGTTDGLWTGLLAATVAMLGQQMFDAAIMSVQIGFGLIGLLALGAAATPQ